VKKTQNGTFTSKKKGRPKTCTTSTTEKEGELEKREGSPRVVHGSARRRRTTSREKEVGPEKTRAHEAVKRREKGA